MEAVNVTPPKVGFSGDRRTQTTCFSNVKYPDRIQCVKESIRMEEQRCYHAATWFNVQAWFCLSLSVLRRMPIKITGGRV